MVWEDNEERKCVTNVHARKKETVIRMRVCVCVCESKWEDPKTMTVSENSARLLTIAGVAAQYRAKPRVTVAASNTGDQRERRAKR